MQIIDVTKLAMTINEKDSFAMVFKMNHLEVGAKASAFDNGRGISAVKHVSVIYLHKVDWQYKALQTPQKNVEALVCLI